MRTEHTPGPWRIGSRLESDNTLEIDNGTKESPLAYVQPRACYDDTQHANARLMAAAPELLEACHAALSVLAMANVPDGTTHTAREAFDAVLAATKKATQ